MCPGVLLSAFCSIIMLNISQYWELESWVAPDVCPAPDCGRLPPHTWTPVPILHLRTSNVLFNYNTQYLEQAFAFLSKLSPHLTLKIFLYPVTHDFISYILYPIYPIYNSQFVNQLKVLNFKSKVLLNITNYKTNRYMSKCQQVKLSLADKDAYFPLV